MVASREVRVVVSALDGFVEQIVKALVLDITANLVRAPGEGGTPVDTGWARANWIPSIGTPRETTAGSRETVSNAAQQQGVAMVATSYRLPLGTAHVANNVAYIVRLNDGSSKQAPRGFVQLAIAKAVRVDLPRKFGR